MRSVPQSQHTELIRAKFTRGRTECSYECEHWGKRFQSGIVCFFLGSFEHEAQLN